ncbi:MAG: AMP-binding protein, partial [bacterium]|nr:AMP-binding protein [bacterium]
YYPLSSAQKRLFVLQQMDLDSTVYNIPQMMVLDTEKGFEVNPPKLEETFRQLIRRHESFRTSFHMIDDQPVQKVHDNVELEIECFGRGEPMCSPLNGNHSNHSGGINGNHSNHSGGIEGNNQGSHGGLPLQSLQDLIRPFDLSGAPLLRAFLVQADETKYLLLADMHHIIMDGISFGVMIHDFVKLYQEEPLAPLPFQYKDYAGWQNSPALKEKVKLRESFWLEEFKDQVPLLELPFDAPRDSVQSFKGDLFEFRINEEDVSPLVHLARDRGMTMFMVLNVLLSILLSKLSGQEDIIIGVPTAGRGAVELEMVIGMFVNTLALRNFPVSNKTINQFLQEVKERSLNAFENQDYQFDDLVEKVVKTRHPGRSPLFDVMMAMQNMGDPIETPPEESETPAHNPKDDYDYESGVARFDMTWEVIETGKQLLIMVEYATPLFNKQTIDRLTGGFRKLVTDVTASPLQTRIADLEIISQEEKHRVLVEFNDTATDYPRDKTIHQLFEENVERIPDRIALEDNNAVTYNELNKQSNHLAVLLKEKGLQPGSIAGIIAKPSLEAVIGIAAILKAGGAYLPIEPDYPEERIDFMLKDSNAGGILRVVGANLVFAQQSGKSSNRLSPAPCTLHPANLSYIMYTSGSTGKPKGVMIEHRSVVRLVKNTNYIRFTKKDRVLQAGALSFDASTFQTWSALLNGLALYPMTKEQILAPGKLRTIVTNHDISIFLTTTALFNQVTTADIDALSGLKNLLVGGDVLSPFHINRVMERFPRLNIINVYGPTENTTFSSTFQIDRKYNEHIPIGKPIANSTVYIVDRNNHLQPVNVAGELLVGGDGVARGYLN